MDWALFIVGILLQAIVGYLGIHVTVKPPRKPAHKAFLCAFASLTIGIIFVAVAQKYRDGVAQARLEGRLEEHLTNIENSTRTLAAGMAEIRKFATMDSVRMATSAKEEKPWGLSVDQLAILARRVAPFARGQGKQDLINCILGNVQSTRFAENLVAAYRSAGWNLAGSGFSQSVFTGLPEGILIKIHSKESNPPSLNELVTTLREAGIEPTGIIDESVPANEYQIIVGAAPEK